MEYHLAKWLDQFQVILMEGALGERIKREYQLYAESSIALAALVDTVRGRSALKRLWQEYSTIAQAYQLPFLATAPTRRANWERMHSMGADASLLSRNVALLLEVKEEVQIPMLVGGLMGCRGDAYTGEGWMQPEEAYRFHSWQAQVLAQSGVDFLYAGIMPVLQEAVGMARAMASTGLPYMISFTIRKDGHLIDGTSIDLAIKTIDHETKQKPVCYMANCVHPRIVRKALECACNQTERVCRRFLGIQANSSPLPYARLEQGGNLFESKPQDWAAEMVALRREHGLRVFGGCCGTDGHYLRALAKQLRE